MRKHIILLWIAAGILTCISFSCVKGKNQSMLKEVDSLNRLAYHFHYIDLNKSAIAANAAFKLSKDLPSEHAEALNNIGFCTFMRMDFDNAEKQFKDVYNNTDNQLELLIADIGLMKIYQRISMNKEFYDYRNSAMLRMKRIQEDSISISDPKEWKRFKYACTEFHITSGVYYYYLQQEEQSLDEINLIKEDYILKNDTSELLYYYYMRGSGGMLGGDTPEDITLGEFNYLFNCYNIAHNNGYSYFEANSLQAFAELFMDKKNYDLLMVKHPNMMRMLNTNDLPWDSLIISMANEALQKFKKYGDMYQISGSYRTLASCCNALGKYQDALINLTEALNYVNRHHELYYHCKDSTDQLFPFIPNSTKSKELEWNSHGIKTVHEWITRLREQLSVTYSALGMKQESDYNRNIYLDLLNYTRQDKELESRYQALQKESSQLNLIVSIVAAGIVILIILLVLLNRNWRIKNAVSTENLKKTLEICQSITACVPVDAENVLDITNAIEETVKDDILKLVDGKALKIYIIDGASDEERINNLLCNKFLLTASSTNKTIGEVHLYTKDELKKDHKTLMNVITPYIAWTIENGLTFISLGDEQKMLESEQYIHEQHLIENKKQNIIKKACLFIVTGIMPYIDRINNEVHKLINWDYIHNEKIKQEKYSYINELVANINEYNDILALWIKMRQGTLSLNIQNFEINSLFDIVAKNRKSFEVKKQKLNISPTTTIAKADKALTLFMINTLMDNARKYTPAGGEVDVYAEETNDYVEISVKDNGPGLSDEDRNHILNEKVYNSKKIGIQTSSNIVDLQMNKGHGFGLMNCKGIIEKYKKTNSLFQVCTFDIESKLGEGSRFFFRLPKGMMKLTMMLLIFLSTFTTSCDNEQKDQSIQVMTAQDSIQYNDPLLNQADFFANRTYNCNVHRDYDGAIANADTALYYLNKHYQKYSKKTHPLALLRGTGSTAEQTWYNNHFMTDYYILLDIRNEAAVAFLALKDFDNYRYNNNAYVFIYKQTSKDSSLDFYCKKMQLSANTKTIAIIVSIILLIVFFITYYILNFHHRLTYRYDLQQVLEINKQLFKMPSLATDSQKEVPVNAIVNQLLNTVSEGMNELITYDRIGLSIFDEENNTSYSAFIPEKEVKKKKEPDEMTIMMARCYEDKTTYWTEGNQLKCLPLWVEAGGENHCIGVIAIQYTYDNERKDDQLMVELVANYMAIIAYNAIVRISKKYQDIESALDETNRAIHEENQLHVQNMVLDNCLSTIKHETIYYPNKIKQIIEKLLTKQSIEDEMKEVETVSDLISYYKDIFTILSSCAAKQLEDITFRRENVKAKSLAEYASNYMKKKAKRLTYHLGMQTDAEDVRMSGDEAELKFLLENLINEAINYENDGTLSLHIYKEKDFVRFDLTDPRREKTQEELNQLFNPHLSHIHQEGEGVLTGTEYLICKQVIREHDEYTGHRGCRINAQSAYPKGFTVWFTIPVSPKRNKLQ
ncbi:MAG: DUF5113 domain-containing protein [Phocaeicola sp.]|uniref:DUF5113 domain-containing protein n=1 Tax=Phocaeicola sp. TaxID=2773926 RepID=UPI003F9EC57B